MVMDDMEKCFLNGIGWRFDNEKAGVCRNLDVLTQHTHADDDVIVDRSHRLLCQSAFPSLPRSPSLIFFLLILGGILFSRFFSFSLGLLRFFVKMMD